MPKNKRKVNNLANVLRMVQITETETTSPLGTVLRKAKDPQLESKWPKLRMNVPSIFLHKPVEFEDHARIMLEMGLKFHRPYLGRYCIKIPCPTFADHKAVANYFDSNKMPYHTYGHPDKRKLKVVIRGLPNDTDLNKVKDELKHMAIPVIRIHKMHTKECMNRPLLVLVVVPHTDDGKTIFLLKKIMGHNVQLEPPKPRAKQCHRCQQWGHSQRYCHGMMKCVKCGEGHFSKKCPKSPSSPPNCANCGERHTANYRKCSHCPESEAHKTAVALNKTGFRFRGDPTMEKLVTIENIDKLYKNLPYDAIPPSLIGIRVRVPIEIYDDSSVENDENDDYDGLI